MATLNLGRIKPVFRGAYAGGTAYVVDDIVTSGNETFICIQASTGNATSNASYWTKLAAKGVDGTDVGATLNNKEIAFKTNAGAVDGIPIGTAGQFLKVNSGATGYEYGAVSSDFVRIANLNVTTGSSVNFNSVFSSSDGYQSYFIKIHRHKPSATRWLKFRWRNSGSTLTNNYRWKTTGFRTKGDGSESTDNYSGNSSAFIPITYWSQRPDGISFATIDLGNPSISSNGHMIIASAVVYESDNGILRNATSGVREATATYDGFEIHDSSTSNFSNMDVSVYGIK